MFSRCLQQLTLCCKHYPGQLIVGGTVFGGNAINHSYQGVTLGHKVEGLCLAAGKGFLYGVFYPVTVPYTLFSWTFASLLYRHNEYAANHPYQYAFQRTWILGGRFISLKSSHQNEDFYSEVDDAAVY